MNKQIKHKFIDNYSMIVKEDLKRFLMWWSFKRKLKKLRGIQRDGILIS